MTRAVLVVLRRAAARVSLRGRLVAITMLVAGVGLAVANVGGLILLRSYLHDRVDSQLERLGPPPGAPLPDGSLPQASLPEGSTTKSEAADQCHNTRDPQGVRADFVVLILDDEGREVCVLGQDGVALPAIGTVTPAEAQSRTGIETVASSDGTQRWRIRMTALPTDPSRTLVVGVSLAESDATVRQLGWISLGSGVVVLVLLATGASWLIGLGLQPLAKIESTAERIARGDLSERVAPHSPGTEVGRLAAALNGMLVQIEDAFAEKSDSEEKLRRFVADASHELRTPLATIRGHAEMHRTGVAAAPEDVTHLMGRIESESVRMGSLVEDMLLLARLDQDRPLERAQVDMLSIATDALVDARARHPERRLELLADVGDVPPVTWGDASRLRQVVDNLIANAVLHTPSATQVRVSLTTTTTTVTLLVADDGPGMPAEVVARVFDRFYRRDPGRSRDRADGATPGTGLGLSIVQSLVTAHDGTVDCHSNEGFGTSFRVRLPIAT